MLLFCQCLLTCKNSCGVILSCKISEGGGAWPILGGGGFSRKERTLLVLSALTSNVA